MKNIKRENQVQESFDVISKEMAEFIVKSRKDQIESEIEKDIIKAENRKRKKDKEKRKTKNVKIQKENESSEIEKLNVQKNDKLKIKSSSSRENLKNFKPKNNSSLNNDKILNKNETEFKKDEKTENISDNNSFKNNSIQKFDKIKKEEVEVSISPFYENEDEEQEINYYNIRNYIEKNKKRLKKNKLNNQETEKNSKNNALFKKKNSKKKNMHLDKNNKKTSEREKREYSFLFKDQQNVDDSDDWEKYLDDMSFHKDNDKVFLYTNSKNFFNESEKDTSSYLDSDQNTTTKKNMIKNNKLIFDYFQYQKKNKKNFFEKQLNRKRLTEIKINRKRERIKVLERKNNYYSPKINELSLQIIRNKGDYIPIFKRAVELENEKKMRILIERKMKNQSFYVNNSITKKITQKQINDFFYIQMDWKNKVEKENNILKLKLRAKESQKNTESNVTSRLSKSDLNISRRKSKPKTYFTLYDNNICNGNTYSMYLKENNKTNIGYRLYKDYEKRQKNLNKLKKILTPTFTPMINKSYSYISRNNSLMNRRRNLSKSTEKSSSLKLEYDSSFNSKQQKSRNPKKNSSIKNINSNNFVQPFNIREINNNLKSTAVDSRHTKSKSSVEIFGTKLEKIYEYKGQDEEISSSDYSLNDISNKNTNSKIYKSNKNNRSTSLDHKKKLHNQRDPDITHTSDEKNKIKLDNLTNKSEFKEPNSNKEESKSIIEHKESGHLQLQEYNSGLNGNLKLEEIKPIFGINQKETNKESQTPTMGKSNSKRNINEKINLNLKSDFKKNTDEIKEINQPKNDKNRGSKKYNDKNNENDNEKKNDIISDSNKNIRNKKNSKINDSNHEKINEQNEEKNNMKSSSKNLSNFKSTQKVTSFRKLFSKEKIENPNIGKFNYIIKKPKSIYIGNKSNSSISNKNNEIEKNILDENTFKNQYDSNETNINQFNFEPKDSNFLNEFLTNKAPSNLSNKEENIFQNSTYYLENQIIGSKNSLNLNIPKETKKEEKKKIMKQYKIYDSEEDESESEEEENEETEKIIDMKNKNEDKGQDKSFSWIKKLNDISRNEAGKSEMNAYNKKKTGGSSTRAQTKRPNDDNNNTNFNSNKNFSQNFNENKLYMLNLRNSSSTGNLNPYTIVAKEPIFYRFFLKKSKKIT